MRIVEQSAEIALRLSAAEVMAHLTKCGNVCYRAESEDHEAFVRKLIRNGHESVLEHFSITMHVVTDRGISHEFVRHRIASYSQESTRFCNYTKDKFGGHIAFILPDKMDNKTLIGEAGTAEQIALRHSEVLTKDEFTWLYMMGELERAYNSLIEQGWTPQNARDVLPTDVKTELYITMNIREWRHFLWLRFVGTKGTPHPKMRKLASKIFWLLYEYLPICFEDIHSAAYGPNSGCG